jgi:hypothetical protein
VLGRACRAQDEQDRRDHQDAHRVAGPPDRPRRPEVAGAQCAGEEQGPAARGRADQHPGERTEKDQRERVPQPVQFRMEPRTAQQQVGADGCDGVARRDGEHRRERRPQRDVHQEGAECDTGPDPGAAQEQARHRDAARRPQRSDLAAHQLLEQPQPGRAVVQRGDGADLQGGRTTEPEFSMPRDSHEATSASSGIGALVRRPGGGRATQVKGLAGAAGRGPFPCRGRLPAP